MGTRLEPAAQPLDRLFAVLPSMPRPILARLTAQLIERLDELDGDTDVETNGDELDGTGGEDDFMHHERNGPGCGGHHTSSHGHFSGGSSGSSHARGHYTSSTGSHSYGKHR